MEKQLQGNLVAHYDQYQDLFFLTSNEPGFENWESIVDENDKVTLQTLRNLFFPETKQTILSELIEQFLASDAKKIEYSSNLVLSKSPLSGNPKMISLDKLVSPLSSYGVFIGINFQDIHLMNINGPSESGRTHLTQMLFADQPASKIDFAGLNLEWIPPHMKKDYGKILMETFFNDSSMKYLLIDHYSSESLPKRKDHPAVYHNIYEQILDLSDQLKRHDKTLILIEGNHELPVDATITLNEDRSFSMGNILLSQGDW